MDVNNSISVILPGVVLAIAAVVVLTVDLFTQRKTAMAWLAGAGMIGAAVAGVSQWLALDGDSSRGPVDQIGFADMIAFDRYTAFCVVLFALVGLATVMLADAYLARRGAARGEFYGLLLLVMAGMVGLVSSTDLVSFFVSFELMSLPTYVLAGYLWRDARAGEASLKYFVTGAFSSAILAFGLALVYGATGQTNFAAIADSLADPAAPDARGLVVVALVLVVTGFGFKVSAVPFHGWAPDVYEGAPTPVTAFMSVAIKAAAFAGFARLLVAALDLEWAIWANALIILAVVTMIVGNVLALPQRNLKRMLAYSSIAHAGYLLLGLVAVGRADSHLGLAAVLFYLAAYAFMNLGAFGILIWIRNRRPFDYSLDQVGGLARAMPWASIFMTLFMVSLTGIPPTIGFWGKFYLFTAVVQADYTWLAIVAVIMSAISAYYYLRVIWYMYFREAPAGASVDATQAPAGAPPSIEAAVTTVGSPAGDGVAFMASADVSLRVVSSTAGSSPAAETRTAADAATPPAGEPAESDRPAASQLGVIVAVSLAAIGVLALGILPEPLLDAAAEAVRLILGG